VLQTAHLAINVRTLLQFRRTLSLLTWLPWLQSSDNLKDQQAHQLLCVDTPEQHWLCELCSAAMFLQNYSLQHHCHCGRNSRARHLRHGCVAPIKPGCSSRSSSSNSSSRDVAVRMYRKANDDLAERTREVWDDEEDIQAAVQRMGLDKQQQAGDSGPLLSEVNKLYVTKDFPKAYIAQQLELRYMEGVHNNLQELHADACRQ
jgi:hypothetical protein